MTLLFSLHKNVPVSGVKVSDEEKKVLGYHASASLPIVQGRQRKRVTARGDTAEVLGRERYILTAEYEPTVTPDFKDTGETRRSEGSNLSVILNEKLTTGEFGEVIKGYLVAQQDASKF